MKNINHKMANWISSKSKTLQNDSAKKMKKQGDWEVFTKHIDKGLVSIRHKELLQQE